MTRPKYKIGLFFVYYRKNSPSFLPSFMLLHQLTQFLQCFNLDIVPYSLPVLKLSMLLSVLSHQMNQIGKDIFTPH